MEESAKNDIKTESDILKYIKEYEVINKKLVDVEKEIYYQEGQYLNDTGFKGSVLRGWETFFNDIRKSPQDGTNGQVQESDRIFSKSSTSFPHIKSLIENETSSENQNNDQNTSRCLSNETQTTPHL
ncbi:hypothetical protein HZS_5810, partial [Henneguya salminicola]